MTQPSAQQNIALIAAMTRNYVIGKGNKMPWHMPADLKHFKKVTLGKPVIMGRKTYESIGRALPGRENLVITRDTSLVLDDVKVLHSIEEALSLVADAPEIMIIGGADIYQQTISWAHTLYITILDVELDGEAFFPHWGEEWQIETQEKHISDDNNPFDYQFLKLTKKSL